jgi:hypothetical protein
MRAILIITTASLLVCGCKSRQVAIHRVDSTSVHSSVRQTADVSTHKDSSTTDSKILTVTDDSSKTETTITPVPGKTITINKDGSFTGEAAKVEVKHSKGTHKNVNTNTHEQKAVKDSSDHKTIQAQKDSTHIETKTKQVVSKPDYGWIKYAVGFLLLMGLLYWGYRKLKSKFLI